MTTMNTTLLSRRAFNIIESKIDELTELKEQMNKLSLEIKELQKQKNEKGQ